MIAIIYAEPTIEPVSLDEIKLHLRLDSGSMEDDLSSAQTIPPAYHGIHELLTLDVAPGGAGWSAGDTITGATSHNTCVVVTVLTTTTYIVKDRSGAFTLGEILSNGTATADQGAANPTAATGYYLIGAGVEVIGVDAMVTLVSGAAGAGGTVDVKIQESDDNTTFTDWTSGAFTQVTTANDNATQKIEYTGDKRYIRAVAQVLSAGSSFGVNVITNAATSAQDDLLEDLITTARQQLENHTRRALLTQTWDYYLLSWPAGDSISLPFGNLQTYETLTLDVAPAVDWAAGDVVTGQTSGSTCVVVAKLTATTYTVQDRDGEFDLDEIIGVTGDATKLADQGASYPTFGGGVSVVWKDTDGEETTLALGEDYIIEPNGHGFGRLVLPYGASWPSETLYSSRPIRIRFTCGWTAASAIPKPLKNSVKMMVAKMYESRGEDIIGQSYAEDKTVDKLLPSYRLWGDFR